MLTTVVVALGFWSAVVADPQVQEPADAPRAEAPAAEARLEAAALAKYNELKEKARNTAEDQWKLAVWCEQNGLEAEAFAHFSNVVRLDPKRLAAWRKLGYKKHHGQWMTDEQIQEENEQKKADQVWAPKLAKLHRQYHEQRTRADAEAELARIEDPRAAIGVFRELGTKGPGDQSLAIQILGQIKGESASKCLALLAVYGASADVRRRATETLRGRESEEFVDLLISLLTDPLKYEVKPVGGPGSPGVLFVEGEKFNVQRVYAPPPPPTVLMLPGSILSYDEYGLPVVTQGTPFVPSASAVLGTGGRTRPDPKAIAAPFAQAGIPLPPTALNNFMRAASAPPPSLRMAVQTPVGQNMIAAQQGARAAQEQLQGDVRLIEKMNEVRSRFNTTVASVLQEVTGENPGDDAKDWKKWRGNQQAYKAEKTKPTLNQLIPLAYNPPFFMRLVAAAVPPVVPPH